MVENKTRKFTGKLWKIAAAAGAVLFWLAVWQIAAIKLDSNLILVSPIDAVKRLFGLAANGAFWRSILFSAGRVLLGFALGLAAGTVLALVSARVRLVRTLFSPLISAMKSIPVASFTILALIWIGSKNLSVLVSFLICVPIVCANMLEGMDSLDPKLGEMADVFRIPPLRRFAGVYLSQLLPFFRSASRLAIGLCWKSGVAAEVIGIPNGSVGEQLYQSKVYLETADLFAWTITVILLSRLCEMLFMLLVDLLQKRVEKM